MMVIWCVGLHVEESVRMCMSVFMVMVCGAACGGISEDVYECVHGHGVWGCMWRNQ